MSCMVFQLARSASFSQARNGSSALGCSRQKSWRVFFLTTCTQLPYSQNGRYTTMASILFSRRIDSWIAASHTHQFVGRDTSNEPALSQRVESFPVVGAGPSLLNND